MYVGSTTPFPVSICLVSRRKRRNDRNLDGWDLRLSLFYLLTDMRVGGRTV